MNESIQALRLRLEKWCEEYLRESRQNGFVVGVSGGIDSALCAKIGSVAAERQGKELTAMSLPIVFDGRTDGIDMSNFYETHGIANVVVDLSSLYQSAIGLLNVTDSVIRSNVRTRLRSLVLYTYANTRKLLVLGTMNRTEFGIGYFQKHAAIGDLLPLAKLAKATIRQLGRSYGFDEELISRKASGCVHSQAAESEWGIEEEALDDMIDAGWHVVQTRSADSSNYSRVSEMNKKAAHKRVFPPVFLPE